MPSRLLLDLWPKALYGLRGAEALSGLMTTFQFTQAVENCLNPDPSWERRLKQGFPHTQGGEARRSSWIKFRVGSGFGSLSPRAGWAGERTCGFG